jgi:hypothetical protein
MLCGYRTMIEQIPRIHVHSTSNHKFYSDSQNICATSIHHLTAEQVLTTCFHSTLCMVFHAHYATQRATSRNIHAASIHRLTAERVLSLLTTRFHSRPCMAFHFHTLYATPRAVHAASIHRLTAERVLTTCFYSTLCMAFHTHYAAQRAASHYIYAIQNNAYHVVYWNMCYIPKYGMHESDSKDSWILKRLL